MKRLHEIDGIRGWAALAVLIFHLSDGVFGKIFSIYTSPLFHVIFNGHLAVCIFFVLSGDALSSACINSTKNYMLAKMVLKRYFRLAGPMVMASILVYLLLVNGLVYNKEAGEIVQNQDWLGSFVNFKPSFFGAIKFGARFAFTEPGITDSYGPFLWPMGIELVGSFGLFLYLAIYKSLRYPLVVLTLMVAALISRSYYSLFCIGAILAHFREMSLFTRISKSKNLQICVRLGILLWTITAFICLSYSETPLYFYTTLAGLFVFLVYCQPNLVKLFSGPLSVYLGKISFPLYVTHFAVMISYTSFIIRWLGSNNDMSFINSVWVILSSVGIAFFVAHLFSKLEDKYLRSLDRLATRFIRHD